MIKKVARKALPAGSRRRIAGGRVKNLILHGAWGPNYRYKIWIQKYEPGTLNPVLDRQEIKFSIVVPAYNTPRRYIEQLVRSVIGQTYHNWELIVADGSSNPGAAHFIKTQSQKDSRIKYIELTENMGISNNTNIALGQTTGDYVAFLDHDDVLPRWALNEVATTIAQYPEADIFYSDEDRLSENGKVRMTPLFKPDWSPDLFLSANYLAHFFIIKKELMNKLKYLRSKYDGSQDYDLVLRALDHNPEIMHISKILYHMRIAKGSTAKSIDEKSYVHSSGKGAIKEYLRKRKIRASVLDIPNRPTNHRIHYKLIGEPLVSIIIPFKDKLDLLEKCLSSIEKSTYSNYELVLISNNSKEMRTFEYLKTLSKKRNIKVIRYDKKFNYSKLNNFGREHANGNVLIFLNNDTEVITNEWIEELASVAMRKEVGAVGPLLLYPDKSIQHAGVILGMTGLAGHIFRKLKLGSLTYFWLPDWPRNYLAVTGACLAVEARKFDQINGFNEKFVMAGSDVVLCIDLSQKGYLNVYWPFVRLLHHESKTVISYSKAPISDYNLSMKLYKPYLNYQDPYFNPNLSLESEIPELRTNYE